MTTLYGYDGSYSVLRIDRKTNLNAKVIANTYKYGVLYVPYTERIHGVLYYFVQKLCS